MRRFAAVMFRLAVGTGSMSGLAAETVEVNLRATHGITQPGFAAVIRDAKAHFAERPNDTYIVHLDAGAYGLDAPPDREKGIIELSGVRPGPEGRLIFRGAGMDKTVLVFDKAVDQIHGRGVYRVSFIGMTLTRREISVSQGRVVSAAPGEVVLDIHRGFPTPLDIFEPRLNQGRYLRRYTDDPADPQLILEANEQVPWKRAEHVEGDRWRLLLLRPKQAPEYKPGDLIGIKSKHGGQPYWFYGGSDFVFEDVRWIQESRGVFRGGFDRVRVSGCVVDRLPPINGRTPCLSTPGGGPQIGQPNDPPVSNNIVENCRMTGNGDDSIAFFNASGIIRGNTISDCFGRGILLYNSPAAVLENNTLIRSEVLSMERQAVLPRRTIWHPEMPAAP